MKYTLSGDPIDRCLEAILQAKALAKEREEELVDVLTEELNSGKEKRVQDVEQLLALLRRVVLCVRGRSNVG